MKKHSNFYPLIFGVVMLVIGLIVQQYIVALLFGVLPIMISVYLFIWVKDKQGSNENNGANCYPSTTIHSTRPYKKDGYIFNLNPEKYKDCKAFTSSLKEFLRLDSKYNVFYRYIAIDKANNQLYEIHTKVVGFEGEYVHTKAVEDFVEPPCKLNFDEFLKLADSIYPGISVLYEGINENNYELYQEVLECWNRIPKEKKPLKKGDIDRSRIRYVFSQTYEERDKWLDNHPYRYPLVAISEFLFLEGFDFVRAVIGGGVDEISHTGDKSYSADYESFEEFRDNFDKDLAQATEEAQKAYGGWVSSLNYGFILAELEKESITFNVIISERQVRISWSNLDKEQFVLVDMVNEKMREILVGDVSLTRELFTK